MNEDKETYINPWELAYELYKGIYTKDEIDEMLFCEINELIYATKEDVDIERGNRL